MEGAVWFGKRLTSEIERLCHTVDSLVREYQSRGEDEIMRGGQHYSTTSFGAGHRLG